MAAEGRRLTPRKWGGDKGSEPNGRSSRCGPTSLGLALGAALPMR